MKEREKAEGAGRISHRAHEGREEDLDTANTPRGLRERANCRSANGPRSQQERAHAGHERLSAVLSATDIRELRGVSTAAAARGKKCHEET
jgi:hypothetical protein